MPLTILPQSFAAELIPKAPSIVTLKKAPPIELAVDNNSTSDGVEVDLSHLEVIKIIPEEKTNGDSDFSSDRSLIKDKNALGTNYNPEAPVVKKINPDTGENVGETPDLNQQKLNQHIREYQKLALEELQ